MNGIPDSGPPLDPVYVEARRVLLDALDALRDHLGSITLVGAQAVYLRVGAADLAVAPYTTDGDIALDPRDLSDDPRLDVAMQAAGFRLSLADGHTEPGIWVREATAPGVAEPFYVPIDLIVPEGVAPAGGRRGARLGLHGNRAARRAVGLEAALVDRSALTITALDPADTRSAIVHVAGPAALLVAKAHKIHDRIGRGERDRLSDKDGADVVRIMQNIPITAVTETFTTLLADDTAGKPSSDALAYLDELFGRRGRQGIQMSARALRLAIDEEQVTTLCVAFTRALVDALA